MGVMNAFVQALVWTTIVGFLYAAWLYNQAIAAGSAFNLSRHLERVLPSLQTVWIALGISVIITVLALILPTLFQRAAAATFCASASSQTLALPDADNFVALCGSNDQAPADSRGASNRGSETLRVSGTALPAVLPARAVRTAPNQKAWHSPGFF